jgi:uncharacterized protein (UPF0332 family)
MSELETLMARASTTIRSAQLLLSEGDFDGSVSRSYYAMFYAAEALLLTKDLKFSSHRSVISLFGEHFVRTGIFETEMGRRLSKTFEKRLLSDYSYAPQLGEEEARQALDWANQLVEQIREYLSKRGDLK